MGVPDLIGYDSAAAGIVSEIWDPVYGELRLMRWQGHRTKVGSKNADEEFERRNETRTVYQLLS